MAEELALKKAKINQGKEIDENKLNQGTDDGGFHANFSNQTERGHIHIKLVLSFALQNSSIGDHVTHSLTHSH